MKESSVLKARSELLHRSVWVLSLIVFLLVVMMRSPYKIPVSDEIRELIAHLPRVVAGINTLVSVCLLSGIWSILRKNRKVHQRWMTSALVLSALFLLCYVTYHFTTYETVYGDIDGDRKLAKDELERVGVFRSVYLTILMTHIVAAAISFPFILKTFVYAWTDEIEKHRSLARKVYLAWLYVSVTGPICYWMLKDYYQ